jgi:hypothetical protein
VGERRTRAFEFLAVFALAWLWLSLRADPPGHPDTSRELAFARDLVDGAELHFHGPWASFAGLVHGTAWIDLLALCRVCGLGIVGSDRVTTMLLAAAVAVSYLGVAQLLRVAGPAPNHRVHAHLAPLAGTMTWLATLPASCEMPIWWQPMLLPVAVAFAHLSLWRLLTGGRFVDGLALGLLCALSFDIHVAAIVWFVMLSFAVPLAAKRPAVTMLASTAAALGYLLIASPAALSHNLEIAQQRGWIAAGLLLCIMLAIVGLLLRSRFAALPLRRRLELAIAAEMVLAAAVLLAAGLPDTPVLMGRYLLPFGPAVVLAVALVIRHRGGSPARTAIVTGLAMLLLLASVPRLRQGWDRELPLYPAYSVRELELIAHELATDGHTWTELVVRLQGPDRALMLGGLASLIDSGEPAAPDSEAGLLVLTLTPSDAERMLAELPPSTRTVPFQQATALLIETAARLDRSAVSACTEALECHPVTLAVVRRVHQAHPKAWIDGQTASEWVREHGGQRTFWRYPVRPGPSTVLELPREQAAGCAWQIVAAEGFRLDEQPSSRVELPPDAAGTLTLARELDDDDCPTPTELPPAPIELDPTWTQLRALLEAQGGGSNGSS